jgi:alanyl-tRNA synthetase
VIADHIRSAVFIIADGVEPSNKEAGYVVRRLIRRAIRQGKLLGIENNFTTEIAKAVLDNQQNYAGTYPELNQNRDKILLVLETEENKFRKTLDIGLREFEKYQKTLENIQIKNFGEFQKYCKEIGEKAFYFYESFGFPYEMFLEEINKNDEIINKLVDQVKKNIELSKKLTQQVTDSLKPIIDMISKYYNESKKEHQKQSQTLSAGKFKSGLADNSEIITKYHTATHLLHAALRQVLGVHVQQSGSNITAERLRFDFSHPDKLTEDQLKKVEDLVNEQIQKGLIVTKETMPFIEAQKQGALAFFGSKYPETVSVFTIGPKENYFSKEVCTGPHIENTKIIGHFEIQKEESAGSGKRRIYAILN